MQLIFPPAAAGQPVGPDDLLAGGAPVRPARQAEPAVAAAVAELAALYAYPERAAGARPWVRANMIGSADGAATADGLSGGLSGAADRLVFSVLRSLADVILVGAGTARAEGYGPARPRETWESLRPAAGPPPIAVLTRRLDLDLDSPLIAGGAGLARTIILTTLAAPAQRRAAAARTADVIVVGPDTVSAAAAVAALGARGHARILAEGGPTVLAQLIAGRALDELCLTISPVLEAGHAGRIVRLPDGMSAAPAGLRLAQVLEDSGYLLCRYLRRG